MRIWPTIFFFCCVQSLVAQTVFRCSVSDSITHESLPGASVTLDGLQQATTTDFNGLAVIQEVSSGSHVLTVTLLGYAKFQQNIDLSSAATSDKWMIMLSPEDISLEEVVVSSTRTGSRIEDQNTKVEVLGQDDLNEEASIVPGNVSSLLGDLAIITVQRTNPVNGNDAIRMQGLDSRYTQLMRDGLPLYGGFSGSLGVLSIPPLDLKQIEIIKGSASTLYGGGAVGGLINFISKEPTDSLQGTVLLNATSLGEYNANGFCSGKNGKFGYTVFSGYTTKKAVDLNADGFTEVPMQQNIIVHPRFFFDAGATTKVNAGISYTSDGRKGGDFFAIQNAPDDEHPYINIENTSRWSGDLSFSTKLSDAHQLSFKSATSDFERNSTYSGNPFIASQTTSYAELNDLYRSGHHEIVGGINLLMDAYHGTTGSDLVPNHFYTTSGVFLQDEWQVSSKLSLQSGIRTDYHSAYGLFVLPRASVYYKWTPGLSVRLAGGSGYKIPDLFDFDYPATDLIVLTQPLSPERSVGSNMDFQYKVLLNNSMGIQFDQSFYYTFIHNPLILTQKASVNRLQQSSTDASYSYGTDSYLRITYASIEWYIGYNHTVAIQQTSSICYYTPFNPMDKFSTTLAYEIENRWRVGIESSWNGSQYQYNNIRVNNYWFFAAMVQRKVNHFTVVLNVENLLNVRQFQFSPTVTGTAQAPEFAPVWAPLEGRVFNLSVKYDFK